MDQLTLFDIPAPKQEKPKITCRKCRFRYKHEYGKMYYCSQFRQKGTSYGNKKVKAGDPACRLYEKE